MASPTFFGDGHTPRRSDTQWIILQKILGALVDGAGGSGSGAQEIYIGRDPAAPDDPTKPALNYPSGGGPMTQWDVGTQAWV